ncbi:MAG: T9SS type A sorting domain-containing protein [Flavobacteriales bacterium]|nr:T9SS type A sorting domain-containing protein [Flavobacteriales bacterium]
MKKLIFSLLGLGAFCYDANSQLLYDQELNPGDINLGSATQQFTGAAADTMIIIADDFTIPDGEVWEVDEVRIGVLFEDPDDVADGLDLISVALYSGTETVPETNLLIEEFEVSVSEGLITYLTFSITPQILNGGTYWFSFWGHAPTEANCLWVGRSNAALFTQLGAFPAVIDEDNYNGLGLTEWTSVADGGADHFDLYFSIRGNMVDATGIEEEEIEMTIYPNPVADVLYIEDTKLEVQSSSIYAMDGQLVAEYPFVEGQIDVSELESGTYLIHLVTDKGVVQKKLMKS